MDQNIIKEEASAVVIADQPEAKGSEVTESEEKSSSTGFRRLRKFGCCGIQPWDCQQDSGRSGQSLPQVLWEDGG